MKEYKYKINGNSYKVTIGDIEDNIAHVEVNGTHYKVEMEKQPKAAPDFPVDCAAGFTTGVVGAAGEFGNGRTTGFAGAAFGCFSISTL